MAGREASGYLGGAQEETSVRYWTVACAIALGACAVRWPAFVAAPHSDDYVQAAMLSGRFVAPRSWLELYDFGGRDPRDAERLREAGWWPWWAAPDLRLAMFRPLSSALLAFDRWALGDRPVLGHLHSAAWLVAWLLGAAALLRRLFAERVALLAVLILALDPSASVPFAWLANRNALVSCALGVWGVNAYVRAARAVQPARRARLCAIAAVLLSLAVLAGEYAIALLPAIALHAWLDSGEPKLRTRRVVLALWALAPALIVLGLGAGLGYGVRSSGAYVSPVEQPLAYASALVDRLPVLAAELLIGLPTRPLIEQEPLAWLAPIDGPALRTALALAALVVLAWAARGERDRLPFGPRWMLAAALAGLPLLAGALPEPRLLLPIAMAGAALVAVAWVELVRMAGAPQASALRRALAGALAATLLVVHVGCDSVRAFSSADLLRARSRAHTAWALRAQLASEPQGVENVVVAARDFTTAQILPYVRGYYRMPTPARYRVLSIAQHPHELTRIDDRTLELRVLGPARHAFAGSLHRGSGLLFHDQERVHAGTIEVRILETRSGQPVRMRFAFPGPLDRAHYRLLHPFAAGVREVAMPAVGDKVALPAPRAMRL